MDLMSDTLHEEFQTILGKFHVGLMIYNAAIFGAGSFVDQDVDHHLRIVRVNVASAIQGVHSFSRRVKEQSRTSSRIILMSTTLGEQGSGYVASYSASKS